MASTKRADQKVAGKPLQFKVSKRTPAVVNGPAATFSPASEHSDKFATANINAGYISPADEYSVKFSSMFGEPTVSNSHAPANKHFGKFSSLMVEQREEEFSPAEEHSGKFSSKVSNACDSAAKHFVNGNAENIATFMENLLRFDSPTVSDTIADEVSHDADRIIRSLKQEMRLLISEERNCTAEEIIMSVSNQIRKRLTSFGLDHHDADRIIRIFEQEMRLLISEERNCTAEENNHIRFISNPQKAYFIQPGSHRPDACNTTTTRGDHPLMSSIDYSRALQRNITHNGTNTCNGQNSFGYLAILLITAAIGLFVSCLRYIYRYIQRLKMNRTQRQMALSNLRHEKTWLLIHKANNHRTELQQIGRRSNSFEERFL